MRPQRYDIGKRRHSLALVPRQGLHLLLQNGDALPQEAREEAMLRMLRVSV